MTQFQDQKMPLAADSAQMNSDAITTGFGWANRLKLAKIIVSQNVSTTKKGIGIELLAQTEAIASARYPY
jgi:hypothetical protein